MTDPASTDSPAVAYERETERVAPYHATLLSEVIDLALSVVPSPRRWLDTGCGPGRLVELARAETPQTDFVLADPAPPMLAFARQRHAELPASSFVAAPSHALPELEPFDVVTAILCHHFYRDEAGHDAALRRCRALVRPGGVFVTVEIVRADTDAGHDVQRRRLAAWQRRHGRAEEPISALVSSEGTQYFPRRARELGEAMGVAGFAPVELFWRAHQLAGLFGIANG